MLMSEYILGIAIAIVVLVAVGAIRKELRRRRHLRKDRNWTRMQDQ